MFRPLSIAIAGIMLSACGSDNKNKEEVNYDELSVTPQSESGLVLADADTLKAQLNNGIRLQLKDGPIYARGIDGGFADDLAVAAPSQPESSGGASGEGFSDTNVHVKGVDESDYVKYDGQHWFIATEPTYDPLSVNNNRYGLKIVATDPSTPSAEVTADFAFDDEWGSSNEIYLVKQEDKTSHVATLRYQWGDVWPLLPGVPVDFALATMEALDVAIAEPTPVPGASARIALADSLIYPGPQNSSVRIDLVDVSSPSTPQQDWSLEVDGSLIQSRKVGNTLYMVTRFDPWVRGLMFEGSDDSVRPANEDILETTPVEQLVPHYRIGDVDAPLTTNCYVQADTKDTYGVSSLIHITAVDLAAQKIVSSTCLNSNVENLSMSTTSLYLTGSVYNPTSDAQTTVVHKFDLASDGPKYAATGSVKGTLGWRSDPEFRMHEYNDQFRIVTSKWGDVGPEHSLSILSQEGASLNTLSTLPNSNRPDAIGKPREDIYSVRFEGDKAYIVTFQRTDPLYAIDLSDPTDPFIAGELEIPGFATYMHPVGTGFLFTLGQDADENGRVIGIKAELIDTRSNTPSVVNTFKIGDATSYSAALSDLRAISFQPAGDNLRIAFPMNLNDYAAGTSVSGMQLMEVKETSGDATLTNIGLMVAQDTQRARYYGRGRSVLHDDAVFMNFGNDVWAGSWFTPKEVTGPIAGLPVYCTADFRMGLNVTISLEGNEEIGQNACDTNVVAMDGDYREVLQASPGKSADQCTFFGAGERAGHYLIEADLPGFSNADAKTTVYRDECHVIPQQVELSLTPADWVICTEEVRPSLEVTLFSTDGNPSACDAKVYVTQDGTSYSLDLVAQYGSASTGTNSDGMAELIAADPFTGCVFSGPGELAGDMVLHVNHPEYEPFEEGLFVPADECHVQTQYLDVGISPL